MSDDQNEYLDQPRVPPRRRRLVTLLVPLLALIMAAVGSIVYTQQSSAQENGYAKRVRYFATFTPDEFGVGEAVVVANGFIRTLNAANPRAEFSEVGFYSVTVSFLVSYSVNFTTHETVQTYHYKELLLETGTIDCNLALNESPERAEISCQKVSDTV